MIGAVILTFVVTSLAMVTLFLLDENQKERTEKRRLLKENDDLRCQIYECDNRDHNRRERSAYNQGLYDGRATDALYRQCLKRYSTREQANVMMNGEK